MIVEILILLMIFGCVFTAIFFSVPRKTDIIIRERLIPLSGRDKKKSVFVQFLGLFAPVNRFITWQRPRQAIARNLLTAGSPMDVNEYIAFKELMLIFMPVILYLILGSKSTYYWLMLAGALGFILPNFWLRHVIARRQKAITKALPEVIDLLELSVGAGLDFMIALGKVLERARPNPLIEELSEVYQETKVGKTKSEALKSMAKRVNLPDVSSFVRTLVQAEKMGTSIGDVLRIQSEQARMWRFQRGERQALKAPLKLLVPLVFFVLPVVLIIVGGPIMLRFMSAGPFFN